MTEGAGGTNAPAVRIVELDSTLKTLRQTNIVFSKGSNAWAQKSIIINTTSNTSFAYVYANIWNGYGTFRMDDVEVREIIAAAPVITSVVLSNVVPNTGASITVTVKATDNTAVTGVTANGTVLQYITSSNVWQGTIIAQAGTHTVMVSAKDAAGNIAWNNSTSYTATTPDTTTPVINSITLSNITPYRGEAIIITVNATDNVGVTVVTANGTALTNLSDNIWSGTIIAESGNHYVNVSAKDDAGNVAWNNTTGYIATTPPDTTAPVITSVVLNNVVVNTGASITVTVKATDNTAVTGVTVNGTVFQYITSSNVWRGTIIAQAGTHSSNVFAKDAAGNTAWNNTTSYTATTPVGSISGFVINDTNRNGRVNTGETGISGWNITISGAGLSLVTSTDSAGYYKFGNLPAGTYTITEESKSGWVATGQIKKVISLASGRNQTNTNFTNARVS